MTRKKEYFQDIALEGLYAAGSFGTAGQVLKSDGDNVYWGADAASGGDAATLDGYDSTAFAILASANKFTQPITVNVNPLTTGPALPTGTLLHLIGTNATQSRMYLDTFGANAAFLGRRANGTNAAPSAILSGDFIFSFGGFGYGTTGYIASASALGLVTATENFTDTAGGAKFSFRTTANGTITPLVRWHIENDGSFIAEGLTVTGNGTVNAVDYFDNGVNINTIYAGLAATNIFTQLQTINRNSAAVPTAITDTILHLTQADGLASRVTVDSFAGAGVVSFRRANNTNTSKTALANTDFIGAVAGLGYGATGYSAGARAQISFRAAEAWTDAAQGTRIQFLTTPNLSIVGTNRWAIENDGSFVYEGGTLTGVNTINAVDYFDNGVNINTIYARLAATNIFTQLQTINLNTSALSSFADSVLHISQADGTQTRLGIDAFGAAAQVAYRRANGTNAAKTALLNNQAIGNFVAFGYGATGYTTTSRATIGMLAAEDWTDTAQGTRIQFTTTPNLSVGNIARWVIENDGSFVYSGGTLTGVSTINAVDYFDNGVNINTIYASLAATNTFTGNVIVNKSGVAVPTAFGSDEIRIVGATGNDALFWADSFGGPPVFGGRRAEGVPGTPTAVQIGNTLVALRGYGYGTSAYSASHRGSVSVIASENWTNTAQGTRIILATTPNLGASQSARWLVENDGSFIYSGGALTGVSTINAVDYFDNGVNINTIYSSLTLPNIFAAAQTIDLNAATLPAPPSTTLLHVGGADAANARVAIDVFGGTANYTGRRSNGTAAAPTALLGSETIFVIGAFGYGATGYSAAARATISVVTTEGWTDTAQGTRLNFGTTTNGTAAVATKWVVENDGSLIYFGGSLTGASTINAVDYFDNGVNINTIYADATNTLTMANKTLTTPTINGAALSGTLSGTPTFSGIPIFSAGLTTGTTSTVLVGTDGNIEIYRSGGSAFIDFKDAPGDDFDVRIQHSGANSMDFNATGGLTHNTVAIPTISSTHTFTNKTLTTPTINGAALSGTLSGTPTFSGVVTFSAAPVFTLSATASGQNSATVQSTDAGAVGATLKLYHDSASPLAGDLAARITFHGKDSGGTDTQYGYLGMSILDPTDTSEDGAFFFRTTVAGAQANRLFIGAGVYHDSATGGDKGNNTLNIGTLYQNNVQVATLTGTEILTNKTLTAPVLGVATATSINGLTITSSTGVLTITNAKTFSVSNTLTLTATDGSTLAIGAGGTLASAAYVATGTTGATIPLLNGTNVWNGVSNAFNYGASGASQVFVGASNAQDAYLYLRANAAQTRSLVYQTGTTNRWQLYADTVAESGSSAGSNFHLRAYDDAGASLGDALSIVRATRVVTFPVAPTFTDAATTRTNLGLGIGVGVQAWDADLDSWALITRAAGFDTFVATPSGANLATLLTTALPVSKGGTNATAAGIAAFNNITGYTAAGATGTTSTNLVFSTSPTLVTPVLGAATATSINGLTLTSSTGVLSITNLKTLSVSNTLTLTATDGSTLAIGAGGTLGTAAYTASSAYQPIDSDLTSWALITRASGFDTFVATPSGANLATLLTTALPVSKGGTNATAAGITAFNNITGYTAAGATGTTSTNLVFSTSPTLVTPVLGAATATSINGLTLTSSTGTITITNAKTLSVSNTLTLTATDGSTLAIGAGGTLASAAYVATGTSGATIPLLNGTNTWANGQTFSSVVVFSNVPTINAANPIFQFYESDQALDTKLWEHNVNGGVFTFRLVNDAYAAASTIFSVTRSTHLSSVFNFGSTVTLQLNGVAIPTISSTDTFTNKTLTSPTFGGTIAGSPTLSGSWTWSSATTFSPQIVIRNTNTDQYGGYLILDKAPSDNLLSVSDALGVLMFRGVDTAGGLRNSAYIQATVQSQTATYVGSSLSFFTSSAGVVDRIEGGFNGGLTLGAPTGSNKGVGTLNATNIYVNDVLVPTISSTDTFTNKTLTTPTINGAALSGTFSGTPTFSGAVTFTDLVTITRGAVALRVTTTVDNGNVQGMIIEGDRATPTANDIVYMDWRLSNSAGTQTEFGRESIVASTVTAASEASYWMWAVRAAGTLTNVMRLSSSALTPHTSDGIGLGSTALMWSDLFLASGGVINFNNGDVTVTHSANTLAFAGASTGYTFDGPMTLSSTVAGNPLVITSTEAGAVAFTVDLFRDSASPAAADGLAALRFRGRNSTPATITYSSIQSNIADTTAASEDANLYLQTMMAGTLTNALTLGISTIEHRFTTPTDSIVSSQGGNGYGSFLARGSGTNSAYMFFSNVTTGERGRIWATDAGVLSMSTNGGVTAHLAISAAGALTASGVAIPTISSTDTLTNKILTTPTINGAAVSGTFTGTPTWTGLKTINLNSATAASPGTTGVVLHLSGADAVSTRLWLDGYGVGTNYTARRANGTNAAKTALLANDVIMNNTAFGHDGTAYSTSSQGAMQIAASENWAVGAHGTRIIFSTVANTTITQVARWIVENDGSLIYSGGSATGVSTVNAVDYFDNGVNINTIYADSTNTLTMSNKTLTNPTINGATLSGTLAGTPTASGSWTWSAVQTFPRLVSAAAGSGFGGTIHANCTDSYVIKMYFSDNGTARAYYGADATDMFKIYDGAGNLRVQFNASTYALTLNGVAVPTISSTDTLTNKTLTSPTINGGTIQSRVQTSSETTGTLTVASANKTLAMTGGVTMPNAVFTAGDMITMDPGTAARTITRGASVTMYVNGVDSATATLAANQMGGAYWRSSSVCILTGAVT